VRTLRIGVVGGSIGGLTAAALLRDAGHEVDVYERTPVPLSGFGTGIVVQPELIRYLLERTDTTLDQISIPSRAMRYFDASHGTLIGEIDADWRYTAFSAIYGRLLAAFGLERYHLGQALVGIEEVGDEVELRFASGRVVHCDLAVCADGGASTARRRLLGTAPKYAGYISWRGLAGQDALSAETWDFFDDRFAYGLLPDGHVITYPIPVIGDDLEVTGRRLNFQWYWNVPEGPELDELMTDRDGIRRPVSVHADGVQRRFVEQLHTRAREELSPEPFVELMTKADKPFLTVIEDTDTPRMALRRICLLGDAAVTGRPHAAAGGAKAAANAWALADALAEAEGDVEEALLRWEPAQLAQGRALLAKVCHMASLLQTGGAFLPGDPACRFGLPPASSDGDEI
jgi:2,6-dihydroxypyridine 3-monooxygenase